MTIPRFLLEKFFAREPRLLRAFADQSDQLDQAVQVSGQTSQAMRNASFVTLGPNDELTSERVLTEGRGIEFEETETALIVSLSIEGAVVSGGFQATLYTTGATNVQLPQSGLLATTAGAEALSNKALVAPVLQGLGDYANDGAAATGGVPIGGVYHDSGALRVRLA